MSKEIDNVRFGEASDALNEFIGNRDFSSVHILCDDNTKQYCLPRTNFESWGYPVHIIIMPSGESHKTLGTCEMVWSALVAQGADRQSLLVNLGGGVVTDLGGFCAASFMRGMPFVHVPTSILGMTDAAIGGKQGVDFKHYKNYIGTFKDPECTIIDPAFVDTLSPAERRNGLAEIVKHGIIGSRSLLEKVNGFDNLDTVDWNSLLKESVAVKQAFVADDVFDRGTRASLNFGHTVGHAIESYSLNTSSPLRHGEAIALGMQVELMLSTTNSGLENADHAYAQHCIERYYGDLTFPYMTEKSLRDLIMKDKKKVGSSVLFALIESIGVPRVGVEVSTTEVNEAYLHFANTTGESSR